MERDASGTALITGAAGFAGRHLVALLESSTSWEIVGLARTAAGLGERTRPVACDLRDADHLRRVIQRFRPDVNVHLAAQSYVPKAIADPAATLANNILGQVNLLESVIDVGLSPRIVIASSSEIYGAVESGELPVSENAALRPENPYAVSKATQDLLGYQYSVSRGLDIVRARPFNHTGPGQSDRFVLSGFARQIAEAEAGKVEPTILTGNLDAERDFLDVRDVVQAYLLLAERGERGGVYNIASGTPRRIGDLLETLVGFATQPLTTRLDPARMRPSDVPVVFGDTSRLVERTGWLPQIPIETTLLETLDYWRQTI